MEVHRKKLKLSNKISELETIRQFLAELGVAWNIAPPVILTLNLVIEEAFTNVVGYAFDDKLEHTIEIVFDKQDNILSISMIDDGKAFDPTQNAEPDINLPVAERSVGGLGVYLIKSMMDQVEYKYKANKNILIMRKKLES